MVLLFSHEDAPLAFASLALLEDLALIYRGIPWHMRRIDQLVE